MEQRWKTARIDSIAISNKFWPFELLKDYELHRRYFHFLSCYPRRYFLLESWTENVTAMFTVVSNCDFCCHSVCNDIYCYGTRLHACFSDIFSFSPRIFRQCRKHTKPLWLLLPKHSNSIWLDLKNEQFLFINQKNCNFVERLIKKTNFQPRNETSAWKYPEKRCYTIDFL